MSLEYLRKIMDVENFRKIEKIKNVKLYSFLEKYIRLCKPSKIFVASDSKYDERYIRKRAIELGEERELKIPGHTVHFDGYYDQARDKKHTYILTPNDERIPYIKTMKRERGLKKIWRIMDGIMDGKELFILFFSLGPKESQFMIPAVQLTDSAYVAHSEFLLYRKAYNIFVKRKNIDFLKFVHSAGKLDDRNVSKNIDKRMILIDVKEDIAFSVNTQYGGNTIGLKKLALRITINHAVKEGWLSEHMFIMGVNGRNGRVSYFAGAFPSLCGKTSTCMLIGERLVGDDLLFIRNINGEARAVNVEQGIFGIIQGINSKDDPYIWMVLHKPCEIIFSNVLIHNGIPYWSGMDDIIPEEGENYSGKWWKGKRDERGNEIPPSHPNARFTVRLKCFPNLDKEALNLKKGVRIDGIIFGGRDKDTWPPVCESFNWQHGVIMKGASLESETTSAVLGRKGIRRFNMMAILDFLSVHPGIYLKNYLEFGKKLRKTPKIFAVNYFLRDKDGRFLSNKLDKKIWLKWMELRVHEEVDVVKSPIGYLPKYSDLRYLFKKILGNDYRKDSYEKQFMIRVPKLLAKINRIRKIYKSMGNIPKELFIELDNEEERLRKVKNAYGNYISPLKLEKLG